MIRCRLGLALTIVLSSFVPTAFGQTVVMEIQSGSCGSPVVRSITDTKWHHKWEKNGRLIVSGSLSESGSTRVKPGSARIELRGNLVTIVYENFAPKWTDEKGQEVLPPPCAWRTPVTFSIGGLESDYYHLILGAEAGGRFRVQTSLFIDEPDQ